MKARTLIPPLLALLSLVCLSLPASAAEDRRATLTGMVWFDSNANRQPDPGERTIRNIEIQFDGLDGLRYQQIRKSSESGSYEFSGLVDGHYGIAIKLPTGYGLSAGANMDVTIDNRATTFRLDFGVARSDQLPSPTPVPTQPPIEPTMTPIPQVVPTSPPIVYYAPPPQPAPPPAAAAPRPAQPAPAAPAPLPTQPPPTPVPPTPETPRVSIIEPTPTVVPTATRVPPALEGQRQAAEQARAALESPVPPRTGSSKLGDDVILDVPFRTALDGSDYSDTDSGPAGLGMILEAYGYPATTADLRALVNTVGRSYDMGQAPRLDLLVRVAELPGLRGLGLYQGVRFTVWSIDDVRERIRAGQPVLTVLRPDDADGPGELGRERFVVIVGLKDGGFIYHDPAYPDQRGARRSLSAVGLTRAWSNGPYPAQAAAFALGRAELGLFASLDKLSAAQQDPDSFADVQSVATPASQPSLDAQPSLNAEGLQPLSLTGAEAAGNQAPQPFPAPWGGLHPLFLGFWLVAGLVFVRVLTGLIFD